MSGLVGWGGGVCLAVPIPYTHRGDGGSHVPTAGIQVHIRQVPQVPEFIISCQKIHACGGLYLQYLH